MAIHKDLTGSELHVAKADVGIGSPQGVKAPSIQGEMYFDVQDNILYTANGTTDQHWQPVGDESQLNVFKIIKIGGNEITASGPDSIFEIEPGDNIQISSSTIDKKITINVTGVSLPGHTHTIGEVTDYTPYSHPAAHPATMITQDSNNRFVTDAEKTTWNGKQDEITAATNLSVNNLTVSGNATVSGDSFVVNAATVEVEDNLILINKGEVGAGVTLGQAGLKVDRGTEDPYYMVFDETEEMFKVGIEGDLEIIASQDHVQEKIGTIKAQPVTNRVTLGSDTATVAIGITGFDDSKEALTVFQNSTYIRKAAGTAGEYTVSGTNIVKNNGTWSAGDVIDFQVIRLS